MHIPNLFMFCQNLTLSLSSSVLLSFSKSLVILRNSTLKHFQIFSYAEVKLRMFLLSCIAVSHRQNLQGNFLLCRILQSEAVTERNIEVMTIVEDIVLLGSFVNLGMSDGDVEKLVETHLGRRSRRHSSDLENDLTINVLRRKHKVL